MKITAVRSHVLSYDLEEELGYSQQYYTGRTAHLVEIETDEGISGWGECFGPGPVAIANRTIVEEVIAPLIVGESIFNREWLWNRVYNLLRDHGRKGMPIQALSGVDIALWDLFGKAVNQPLYNLVGGALPGQPGDLRLRHDAAAQGRPRRALRRRGAADQGCGFPGHEDEGRPGPRG